VVSPAHKKQAVTYVTHQGLCSVRRACRVLKLNRSTYQYRLKLPTAKQQRLKARIIVLSQKHPRYGYRRIRALLDQEGWQVSRKLVQKIRREEGLKVKPKQKKIPRQGTSTGLPTQAEYQNHVWTWDFIFDRTDKGTPLKIMTLLDEYTRRCLTIRPARRLTSLHVLETISQAMALYGPPDYIRSDNGSEFIAQKVQAWLKQKHIKTIYIDPGSPWQNGYIESFHSRLRDECLNREVLLNVPEAQVVLEDFRQHYNWHRPHSKLGYISPEVFIRQNINPSLSHLMA
jgi:putative transposase